MFTTFEWFRWCQIRQLNLLKKNNQQINKSDKEVGVCLDYKDIDFPVSKNVS